MRQSGPPRGRTTAVHRAVLIDLGIGEENCEGGVEGAGCGLERR